MSKTQRDQQNERARILESTEKKQSNVFDGGFWYVGFEPITKPGCH